MNKAYEVKEYALLSVDSEGDIECHDGPCDERVRTDTHTRTVIYGPWIKLTSPYEED